MRSARDVAEDTIRLMREIPNLDVYLDTLTAAIEARDAEHATEATRLRDQLRVARELLGKSQRFISAAREYLLAAIASLETRE